MQNKVASTVNPSTYNRTIFLSFLRRGLKLGNFFLLESQVKCLFPETMLGGGNKECYKKRINLELDGNIMTKVSNRFPLQGFTTMTRK